MSIKVTLDENSILADAQVTARFFGVYGSGTHDAELVHSFSSEDQTYHIARLTRIKSLICLYLLIADGKAIGSVLSIEIQPGLKHVAGFSLDPKWRSIRLKPKVALARGELLLRKDGKDIGLSYYLFGVYTLEEYGLKNNVILEVTNYNHAALSLYRNLAIQDGDNAVLSYGALEREAIEQYARTRGKVIGDQVLVDEGAAQVVAVRWAHVPKYNNVLTWSLNRVYSLNGFDDRYEGSGFARRARKLKLYGLGALYGRPFSALSKLIGDKWRAKFN